MKKIFVGIGVALALLASLSAHAGKTSRRADAWRDPAKCPAFEQDAPGGCLADYPYESQEGTYACYGFTATKLYDCFLARKGARRAGVHSSAIQATLDTVDVSPMLGNYKSGVICDVLDHVLVDGACADADADRALDRKGHYGAVIDDLVDLRQDYRKILEKQAKVGEQSPPRWERRKRWIEEKTHCLLESRSTDPELFADMEPILAFLSASEQDSAINALLFGKSCRPPSRLRVPAGSGASCVRVTPDRQWGEAPDVDKLTSEQLEFVVSELSRGRVAGLSMCAEALMGKGSGVNWDRNPPSGNSSVCSSHATTVIGSRFHRGRCQLKVFDSTGALAPTDGKAWLDAEHLMQNTWGVTVVSEPLPGN